MSKQEQYIHRISVVIPVYLGETTLRPLIDEMAPLFDRFTTPGGSLAVIDEVLLVNDNGPDNSADTIRSIEAAHSRVRGLWLTRNFGQHAATLAGMASSGSDWIVTMDEDGQHDPADIGTMLDVALGASAHIVYGAPINRPPHSPLRFITSRLAKKIMSVVFTTNLNNPNDYQSFRLLLGEVGRSVAAYAGSGVYLDVALGWVSNRVATAPITLRAERRESSGYSYRSLAGHFWRMVLSSGTRGLRLVSVLGIIFAVAGVALAAFFGIQRLIGIDVQQGWTSIVIVVLLSSGAILFSLGIIAEYVGIAVNMAIGKPLYMIMGDPSKGPLGKSPRA
jgi:undecaprenyl-phosphate 4-deoxy-4-formamido-L-arabinose transferase